MRVPLFVYADQIVGESKETYRARTKTCPFNIPFVRNGNVSSTVAEIQTMSLGRVVGQIRWSDHDDGEVCAQRFNVKHDGTKFSVGSGSGKQTFYFKNWDKK